MPAFSLSSGFVWDADPQLLMTGERMIRKPTIRAKDLIFIGNSSTEVQRESGKTIIEFIKLAVLLGRRRVE